MNNTHVSFLIALVLGTMFFIAVCERSKQMADGVANHFEQPQAQEVKAK